MPKSPEFSKKTADTLAKRAAQWCSNPDCTNSTSGPHSEQGKAINVGEAAHIRGAKPGSARYDPHMTDERRSDISNGIWLCTGCAKVIDKDEIRFTVKVLLIWKEKHEQLIQYQGVKTPSDFHVHEEVQCLRMEKMELVREIEKLQIKLKSKEDFESQYDLVLALGGDAVYASRTNSSQYACQSCWDNKGNKEILKVEVISAGTFECPGCKNYYRVNPRQERQQRYAEGFERRSNTSWMG